jgi:hypothetical protein
LDAWEPSKQSSGQRRRLQPRTALSVSAAICTTGTTHEIFQPLNPRYISPVDSDSLAEHLIALANACREWRDLSPDPVSRFASIGEPLDLIFSSRLNDRRSTQTVTWVTSTTPLPELAIDLRRPALTNEAFTERLASLGTDTMADIARTLSIERDDSTGADTLFWAEATRRSIESHHRDLRRWSDAAASGGSPLRSRKYGSIDDARDVVWPSVL